jgi:predicted ATPase/DNA-binding CsgD family transcriptional regulator
MIASCLLEVACTGCGQPDALPKWIHPGLPRIRVLTPCDTWYVKDRTSRAGVVVSGREAEVFDLVGDQLTHDEIGERLFISPRTVESHVASLRRKLGMIDHRSFVRLAVESRQRPRVNALPEQTSSFFGRSAEIQEVIDAVAASRVVSVVGPGGTGKTRLVLTAADVLAVEASRVPVWVDLAAVVSLAEVAPTLALAMGIVEPGRRTHEQAAIDALGQRDVLLVLDNCEQVLDEVALLVERVLAVSANVAFLLTSRIRLAVPHERVVQLGGLGVGSADDPGAAVDLFIERASAAGAKTVAFEQPRVVDICRALDGMPLAIELAAARVATIGLDGVENGLGDHRQLLVGGPRVQSRHRSVSDTVAWSYQLLTRLDQQVLSRVSAFRTPFAATDAGMVAGYANVSPPDISGALGRLAQNSLLEPCTTAIGMRYRMLETVRQFGTAQLEAASDSTARERHLDWCSGRVADLLGTEREPGWAADVDATADETKAALSSIPDGRGGPMAHGLARQVAGLLFSRGRTTDAQRAFEHAATLAYSENIAAADLTLAASVAKCRVMGTDALRLEELAAHKAFAGGDIDLAVRCITDSAQLIVRFSGMFDNPPPIDRALVLLEEARANSSYSSISEFRLSATEAALDPVQNIDKLEGFVHTALTLGETVQASGLFDAIASRHIENGDPVTALEACRRRLDLFESPTTCPDLGVELKDALHTAIFTATGAGQLKEAAHLAEHHALLSFLSDEPGLALEEGIAPASLAGNWDAAIKAGAVFLAGWEQAGRPIAPGRGMAPAALAMVHGLRADNDQRAAWLETLHSIRGSDVHSGATGYDNLFDAIVALHHDRYGDAAHHLAACRSDRFFGALFRQWHVALAAEAAVLSGQVDADVKILDAVVAAQGNPIATALVLRARALHNETTGQLDRLAADFDRLGCPYQAARTLQLAGGASAERGATRLRTLGATAD